MLSTLGNWPRLPVANLVHFLALLVRGLCHFLLHLRPGAVSGGSTPRLRKRPARVARLIRPLRFLRRGRGAVAAAVASRAEYVPQDRAGTQANTPVDTSVHNPLLVADAMR